MTGPKTSRVVLLGKSGAGKSSLANTMFGENAFTVGHTLNSETKRCEAKTGSVKGREMTLIDTPGFFDTDRPEEELKPEVVRCITECSPGPHAFLIVLKVERFTEQEEAVVTKIRKYFSEEVFKYATILFTHGDQLTEGQTIKDFVSQSKSVTDLLEKCGGRCHVIDSKYWKENPDDEYRSNRFQVDELLKTIDKTVEENQGGYYTNEMLQEVEEEIQKQTELIRQKSGNMSEDEIREQAKHSVHKQVLFKVTHVPALALLGAFWGLGGILAVYGILKIISAATAKSVKVKTGAECGDAARTGEGGGRAEETGEGDGRETAKESK